MSRDSQYLYVLNSRMMSVNAFAVKADGSLTPLPSVTGVPTGTSGLVAR